MRLIIKILTVFFAALFCLEAYGQADRHEVRKGNRQFRREKWGEADVSYRKALLKDSLSFAANYNLANNLYRQNNMQEAGTYMDKALNLSADTPRGGDASFNKGDIAIASKDWQAAVNALKDAMLANPDDLEAKENYAYAKKMLENQQNQQNQGGGGQNQDNNQDDNQDNNQDQNQDQDQDNNQENNQNQDNNQKNQDNDQDQNQDQGQSQGQDQISPQQAQQILQAIQSKEKETMDKVKKEKADLLKSRQNEKNW